MSNKIEEHIIRYVIYVGVGCGQVPLEVFGLMQQIYNRALHSLGPDVGCYAPPKLYENELKESLQVKCNF